MSSDATTSHRILYIGPQRVAVVPAQRLSWHRVTLPAGALGRGAARGRLRAILEGLLEEQVLDEPAALHFALEPDAKAGQPAWVAVCDRAWLRGELAALEREGDNPQRIVPQCSPPVSAAATTEKTLWIRGTDDAPQVMWADAAGVHLRPVSDALAAAQILPPDWVTLAQVRAEPGVAAWAERWLGRAVQVETPAEHLLEAAQGPWDLAQLDMARRSPLRQRLSAAGLTLWQAPLWRPARWAAFALVLVHVLGLNVWAWRASAQEQAQRDAIRTTLQATFPAVTVIVDPVLQMQRQVEALRQQSGQLGPADLEVQLAALGSESVGGPTGIEPIAIEYAAGESRWRGVALGAERLDPIRQALQSQGLSVRLEGADLTVRAGGIQ